MKKYIFTFILCVTCSLTANANTPCVPFEHEIEYFDVKYIEINMGSLKTLNDHFSLPDHCEDGYVYNSLRDELDKYLREDEKPKTIYGCGSPHGKHVPADQKSETLFLTGEYRIVEPRSYVEEDRPPWLFVKVRTIREGKPERVETTPPLEIAMPLQDDKAKRLDEFTKSYEHLLKDIADTIYVCRGYHYTPEERAQREAEYRKKVFDENVNFIKKFGHDPEKVRKKYNLTKSVHEALEKEFPENVDALYQEYFKERPALEE